MIPNLVQPSAAPTVGGVEREGQAQPAEEDEVRGCGHSEDSLGVAPCGGLVDCLGGAPLPCACEVGRRVLEGLCQRGPRCLKPRITQAPRSLYRKDRHAPGAAFFLSSFCHELRAGPGAGLLVVGASLPVQAGTRLTRVGASE